MRRAQNVSVVFVLLLVAGCSTALDKARQTVTAAATFARSTGEMIIDMDKDRQDQIEAELAATGNITKAKEDRDAWREKRIAVRKGLKVVNAAVVAASVGLDPAFQGQISLAAVMTPVLKAVVALKDALKAFGVALPGGVF